MRDIVCRLLMLHNEDKTRSPSTRVSPIGFNFTKVLLSIKSNENGIHNIVSHTGEWKKETKSRDR